MSRGETGYTSVEGCWDWTWLEYMMMKADVGLVGETGGR